MSKSDPLKKRTYPSMRYHKTKEPVLIQDAGEDAFLEDEFPGEWKLSPADHDLPPSAPSLDQLQAQTHGFSIEDFRKERAEAKKAAAAKKLAEADGVEELSEKNRSKLGLSDRKK